MSPSPWRKLRSTNAWRQLAKRTIAEEPLCWLRLAGCTVHSTTADHIIPVTTRPDLALIRTNTRGACRNCNYKRGNTPASQLAELRQQTQTQLDEGSATRRHMASRHKPAPALAFFATQTPAVEARACELCGKPFRSQYADQRTCGRECGVLLRQTVTLTQSMSPRTERRVARGEQRRVESRLFHANHAWRDAAYQKQIARLLD
jgi:hypothetical protein